MTLVFSARSALLAAAPALCYVKPFVGRFDIATTANPARDRGARGGASPSCWDEEGGPEIVTASVRTNHVTQAALMGADIATDTLRRAQEVREAPAHRRGQGEVRRRLGEGLRRGVGVT